MTLDGEVSGYFELEEASAPAGTCHPCQPNGATRSEVRC